MQYKHVVQKLHLKLRTLDPTHPQIRTLSSTFSGFKDALLDVTVFPASENPSSDMELTNAIISFENLAFFISNDSIRETNLSKWTSWDVGTLRHGMSGNLNKLAKLQATLVRNYDLPTDRLAHRGEV